MLAWLCQQPDLEQDLKCLTVLSESGGLGQGSVSVCLGSSWYPAVLHNGGWREPGQLTDPSERTVVLRFAYFLGSLVYWYSITDKKGDEI